MKTGGPATLRSEHAQLHEALEKATREPGALGEAEREVARLMHVHFDKEEQYAMPPLELLDKLAWAGASAEMAAMLPLTRRLKAELPLMLLEHREIVDALARLRNRAQEAGREDYVRFADALTHHAQMEEEILYPAAVLVGEYLELAIRAAATR